MTTLAEQFSQALEIMLLGMGLVFVFLTTMIFGVRMAARFLAPKSTPSSNELDDEPAVSPVVVAAITSAVHQYRKQA